MTAKSRRGVGEVGAERYSDRDTGSFAFGMDFGDEKLGRQEAIGIITIGP